MKLSIFTTCTRPIKRQDPVDEAIHSYSDLADEVIVIDGDDTDKDRVSILHNLPNVTWINKKETYWPTKFEWPFIGQQFQRGYEVCTGDWVIHADIDCIFHEQDMAGIRKALENCDAPAMSFWKYQFIRVDSYNLKSRCVLAVNKKKYGDRIKFDSGGDLCQPSLDGKELMADDVPEIRFPFYNFDFCWKTKDIIDKDWARFSSAYKREFGKGFGNFNDFAMGKFSKVQALLKLEEHPKYIQERIKNMTPEMHGYNLWGKVDKAEYFKC